MATLDLCCVLEGHTDRVWHAALHPTRDLLATSSSDRTVRLWAPRRVGDRSEWCCTGLIEDFTVRTVRCSAWSPDGRFLACASFDSTVSVWALTSAGGSILENVATLQGHDNEVKCVAWSPSGTLLATCSRDKSVWLWEYVERDAEFECAAVLHGHSQDVKAIRWHPTRELLMSASYDDTVRAWGENEADADWVCTQTLAGHSSTVWSLAFSPEGDRLATVSDDCSMILWDAVPAVGHGENQGVVDALKWRRAATLEAAHARAIFSVDWSPPLPPAPGAAAAASLSVASTNSRNGNAFPPSATAEAAAEAASATHATPTTLIATAGADNAIRLFAEPRRAQRRSQQADGYDGLGGGEDGGELGGSVTSVATDGGAGKQAPDDAAAGFFLCCTAEQAHPSDINCVLWHPRDPGLLFSAGDDGCVRVWRLRWL